MLNQISKKLDFNKLFRLSNGKTEDHSSNQINRQAKLARLWSNQELRKVAKLFPGNIVNVSASDDGDKEGGYYGDYFEAKTSYTITNYTGDRGYQSRDNEILLDITSDLPEELKSKFDVVFNHTMLEHVFDIFTAFKNLCELSKDVVILVVPFAQYQHAVGKSFEDYWRFTPTAIQELFQRNNFQVIYESESPYEDAAIYLFFVASRYPEKWEDIIPKYEAIKRAGAWIGKRK